MRALTPKSTRVGGGVSRELDARLVETAAGLFSRYGFAEVSVDQIAAAAQAGKQSIYRRYPNKEDLFKAAVSAHYLAPMTQLWQEEVAGFAAVQSAEATPLAALRAICRRVLAFVLRPDALSVYRLLVAEGWRFPEWTAVVAKGGETWELLIEAQLSRAHANGEIAGYDPVDTPRVLVGLLTGWALRHGLSQGPALQGEEIDRYFDTAWQVFLDGVRGCGGSGASAPASASRASAMVTATVEGAAADPGCHEEG